MTTVEFLRKELAYRQAMAQAAKNAKNEEYQRYNEEVAKHLFIALRCVLARRRFWR